MLMAYQSKQHNQLLAQHEREEKDLQEKVSVRRALLEEKVLLKNNMDKLFVDLCHYFAKKIGHFRVAVNLIMKTSLTAKCKQNQFSYEKF